MRATDRAVPDPPDPLADLRATLASLTISADPVVLDPHCPLPPLPSPGHSVLVIAPAGPLPPPDHLPALQTLAQTHDLACTVPTRPFDLRPACLAASAVDLLARLVLGVPGRPPEWLALRRDRAAVLLPPDSRLPEPTALLADARARGLRLALVAVAAGPAPEAPSLRGSLVRLREVLVLWWSRLLFAGPAPQTAMPALKTALGLLVLALVASAMLWTRLDYPLLDPDEGRHAEIARGMVRTGDWIVPRVFGEPYFEKPPLFHWLLATSMTLLGPTELAVRIVPAAAALATVLLTFGLGRRLIGDGPAFLGALVLALSPGPVICGRYLILDSTFTALVTLALLAAALAVVRGTLHLGWWVLAAIACGLALLAKGPLALMLVLPPLAAYVVLTPTAARPHPRHWAAFLAVAVLVALPWYVLMAVRQPHFAEHFFLERNLHRFIGNAKLHPSPAWYYLPVLIVGFLPWSWLFGPLAFFLLRRTADGARARPASLGFLVLWLGWGLVFLSLSRGKLPSYALPLAPPLALMLGALLHAAFTGAVSPGLGRLVRDLCPRLGLAGILVAGAAVAGTAWFLRLASWPPCAFAAAGALALLAALTRWGHLLQGRAAWAVCALAGLAPLMAVACGLVPAWSLKRSPLAAAHGVPGAPSALRLARDERLPILCYNGLRGSVPFYRGTGPEVYGVYGTDPRLFLFFEYHHRSLVVLKRQDLPTVRRLLPSGLAAATLADAGEAVVLLVEPLSEQAAIPTSDAVRPD